MKQKGRNPRQEGSSPQTHSNTVRKLLFQAHVKGWGRGGDELQKNWCLAEEFWAVRYPLETVYVHQSCDHEAVTIGHRQRDSRGRHESSLLRPCRTKLSKITSASSTHGVLFHILSSDDLVLPRRMGKERGTVEGWIYHLKILLLLKTLIICDTKIP